MDRRSSEEILKRLRSGHMYDEAGILHITKNLAFCELPKLIDKTHYEAAEWCREYLKGMNCNIGSVDKISYLYSIKKFKEYALENSTVIDNLMFLASLSFLGRQIPNAYMNIAVLDLLKAANMEEEYNTLFKRDAELFCSMKNRDPKVRDVLKESFNLFGDFGMTELNFIPGIITVYPKFEKITKPFFREWEDFDERKDAATMRKVMVIDWTWNLMVEAPLRILYKDEIMKKLGESEEKDYKCSNNERTTNVVASKAGNGSDK